uniref:Uncharacterized protein n=1 Tax=viral metagenome TaxID=1070528 RepID=A0A6H1ZPF1_9ZZZZ
MTDRLTDAEALNEILLQILEELELMNKIKLRENGWKLNEFN